MEHEALGKAESETLRLGRVKLYKSFLHKTLKSGRRFGEGELEARMASVTKVCSDLRRWGKRSSSKKKWGHRLTQGQWESAHAVAFSGRWPRLQARIAAWPSTGGFLLNHLTEMTMNWKVQANIWELKRAMTTLGLGQIFRAVVSPVRGSKSSEQRQWQWVMWLT